MTPEAIIKAIKEWPFLHSQSTIEDPVLSAVNDLKMLEKEMKEAAQNLDFERAAYVRDLIAGKKRDTNSSYANNEIGSESTEAKRAKKGRKQEDSEKSARNSKKGKRTV
jgi:excinuclease UvrABC nuclease subunit